MSRPVGGQNLAKPRRVHDSTENHTALLAWQDEQDAERAPILRCVCFVAVGDANHEIVEYEPEGCELHRGTLGKPA
jgi:hypothetical protein